MSSLAERNPFATPEMNTRFNGGFVDSPAISIEIHRQFRGVKKHFSIRLSGRAANPPVAERGTIELADCAIQIMIEDFFSTRGVAIVRPAGHRLHLPVPMLTTLRPDFSENFMEALFLYVMETHYTGGPLWEPIPAPPPGPGPAAGGGGRAAAANPQAAAAIRALTAAADPAADIAIFQQALTALRAVPAHPVAPLRIPVDVVVGLANHFIAQNQRALAAEQQVAAHPAALAAAIQIEQTNAAQTMAAAIQVQVAAAVQAEQVNTTAALAARDALQLLVDAHPAALAAERANTAAAVQAERTNTAALQAQVATLQATIAGHQAASAAPITDPNAPANAAALRTARASALAAEVARDAAGAARDAAEADRDNLRRQLAQATNDLTAENALRTAAEAARNTLQAQVAALQATIAANAAAAAVPVPSQRAMAANAADVQTARAERDALQLQLDQTTADLAEARRNLAAAPVAPAAGSDVEDPIIALRGELHRAQTDLAVIRGQSRRYFNSSTQKTRELEEANRLRAEAEAGRDTLMERLRQSRVDLADCQRNLAAAQQAAAPAEPAAGNGAGLAQASRNLDTANQLRELHSEMRRVNSRSDAEKAEAEAARDAYKGRMESAEAARDALQAQVNAHAAELAQERANHATVEAARLNLVGQLEQCRNNLISARSDLYTAQQAADPGAPAAENGQQVEINRLRRQLRQSQAAVSELRGSRFEPQINLEAETERRRADEAEIATLRAQIAQGVSRSDAAAPGAPAEEDSDTVDQLREQIRTLQARVDSDENVYVGLYLAFVNSAERMVYDKVQEFINSPNDPLDMINGVMGEIIRTYENAIRERDTARDSAVSGAPADGDRQLVVEMREELRMRNTQLQTLQNEHRTLVIAFFASARRIVPDKMKELRTDGISEVEFFNQVMAEIIRVYETATSESERLATRLEDSNRSDATNAGLIIELLTPMLAPDRVAELTAIVQRNRGRNKTAVVATAGLRDLRDRVNLAPGAPDPSGTDYAAFADCIPIMQELLEIIGPELGPNQGDSLPVKIRVTMEGLRILANALSENIESLELISNGFVQEFQRSRDVNMEECMHRLKKCKDDNTLRRDDLVNSLLVIRRYVFDGVQDIDFVPRGFPPMVTHSPDAKMRDHVIFYALVTGVLHRANHQKCDLVDFSVFCMSIEENLQNVGGMNHMQGLIGSGEVADLDFEASDFNLLQNNRIVAPYPIGFDDFADHIMVGSETDRALLYLLCLSPCLWPSLCDSQRTVIADHVDRSWQVGLDIAMDTKVDFLSIMRTHRRLINRLKLVWQSIPLPFDTPARRNRMAAIVSVFLDDVQHRRVPLSASAAAAPHHGGGGGGGYGWSARRDGGGEDDGNEAD